MKKILAFLLLILMLFSFTACGDEAAESSKPSFLNKIKNDYMSSSGK